MNKRNNGFTLVELLAVIVVLSIILVIATSSVLKYIDESKKKTKYMAAKEIVQIAEAYFITESSSDEETNDIPSVSVKGMVEKGYLEKDVTNPKTGENISDGNELGEQCVCKSDNYSAQDGYEISVEDNQEDETEDDNANVAYKGYYFDGYFYSLDGNCPAG